MELGQYLAMIRRWLWLILLATGIAAGTSWFAARQMPKIYQASTKLIVGQSLQNPNPSSELLNISQQLAQTYAQIAATDSLLQTARDALGISIATDRLREQVNVRNIPGTALIDIRVVDTDPLRAQAIANELGRQLILQSTTAREQADPQREFVQNQAAEIQHELEKAQLEVKELRSSIKQGGNSLEIDDKQVRIEAIQNQIIGWQQSYAGFINYLAPRATNYISIIEPASLPVRPIAPNVPLYVLSSASIGLFLALGGVFIIEYVDGKRKPS